MKDFWGFYQNLNNIQNPFQLFSLAHIFYLLMTFLMIYVVIKKYKKIELEKKLKWQKMMACYFFIEEIFYYSWILVSCKENLLFELISLELCTFCAWMNVSTFFIKINKFVSSVFLLG